MKTILSILTAGIALSLFTGCAIAPVATSFESARLVKPGKVQAAIVYSSYSAEVEHRTYSFQNGALNSHDNGSTFETLNNNYGIKIIAGGKTSNLGFHFEKLVSPRGGGINYFSVEPKFQLSENISAFSIPVGIYFSNGGAGVIQLTPTFLFTFSDDKYFEFNLSPKALVYFNSAPMFSIAAGIGLSSDLSQWAIRPELGYTISTSSLSTSGILHVGAGVSINFGN